MKDKDFKINEPTKEIKGGSKRRSTLVDTGKFEKINRRIELNQLVMVNCPDRAAKVTGMIKESDHEILRLMAQETVITRNNPTARRKAIHFIGHFPTIDNINFLTGLAELGDDHYIRGEAITALSRANLSLGLPIFVSALSRKHPFEVNRAFDALVEYGRTNDDDKIQLLYNKERSATVKKQLSSVLSRIRNPDIKRIKGGTKEDDDSFRIQFGPGTKGFRD